MSRNYALKGLGQLTLAALGMVLAAAPPARADVEMASQCFILSPYGYTMRFARIASDQTPGMQALLVRFRYAGIQMLGTGVRANSLTPPNKEMTGNFTATDGSNYRWTASLDPTTSTGPWTIYENNGTAIISGTLVKVACEGDAALTGASDAGSDSPALPR